MKQENLFDIENDKKPSEPVECLGMTFESDEARRAHFTDLLREKLKDPEFRAIEGFPIGTDEAILELSDPPYYTACPNPWLSEIVKSNLEKPVKRITSPKVGDVIFGKNEKLYRLPSYHTKVPPKAIAEYLEHYTRPGDFVLDAFSGSGMLGVANGLMNDGSRNVILSDLSPYACFISNFMSKQPGAVTKAIADKAKMYVDDTIGHLYSTSIDGQEMEFDYMVWSEFGDCPHCSHSFRLYDVVVDYENQQIRKSYNCPSCQVEIISKKQKRTFISEYDSAISKTISVVRRGFVS